MQLISLTIQILELNENQSIANTEIMKWILAIKEDLECTTDKKTSKIWTQR